MSWRNPYSLGELTVPQQDIARMEFLDSDDLDAEEIAETLDRAESRSDFPGLPATKTCPTCRTTKTAIEFGPNRARRDGLQSQCRSCRYPVSDAWQVRKIREDAEFAAAARRRRTAYNLVGTAVRNGTLTKPAACEGCGADRKLQGHHWHGDYAGRPLDVEWLCAPCHGAEHATEFVPGESRQASHHGSGPARVHARGGEEPGLDGCLPAPTPSTR